MSFGRPFRVYRSFLPLMAAGLFAACGSDSNSFGEPFSAASADAGIEPSTGSAGRAGSAAGSGGKAAGGRGGSADRDEDAGQKEDASTPKAGAGGMSGHGGAGGSAGHAAGSGGAAGGSAAAVSFGDIFSGTIQLGCSCHSGGAGGLDLGSRATAYKNLVSVASSSCDGEQRVVPGKPESSVLLHALNHTAIGSCKVPSMPQGGKMLTQTQLDQIQAWIAAGAPNN